MKSSDVPAKFNIPWASAASSSYVTTPIPQASQIPIAPGRASLTDGFPPLNFLPEGAGGVFPYGADMNGVLNMVTAWSRWQAAGAPTRYDSAFSAAIGGYPLGAMIASSLGTGLWLSAVDDNVTNPEAGGTGWVFLGPASTGIGALLINSSISATMPVSGVIEVLDLADSGTQQLTTRFDSCSPNQFVFQLNQLGGGVPQVLTPAGVYLNFTGGKYSALSANVLPQGIWNVNYNQVTFGRKTLVGDGGGSTFSWPAAAVLSSTLWVFASLSTNGASTGLILTAYNPTTGAFGASVTIPSLTACVGLYATSATSFIAISGNGAVAGSVAGVTITTGSAVTYSDFKNGNGTNITGLGAQNTVNTVALSSSSFLLAGQNAAATDVAVKILTVSGTTITAGTAVNTGASLPNAYTVNIDVTSATAGLIGIFWYNVSYSCSLVAFTVSGTVPSFGAASTLSSGIPNTPSTVSFGITVNALATAGQYFVSYAGASGSGSAVVIATLTGTTIALGTAVTSSDRVQFGMSAKAVAPYPQSSYAQLAGQSANNYGFTRTLQYGPSTFIVVGADHMTAFTISGSTISAGTHVSANAAVQSVDGAAWFYMDPVAGQVYPFTVSGNTITAGAACGAPFGGSVVTNCILSAFSANLTSYHIKVGGAWYPYVITGLASTGAKPMGSAGQNINFGGSLAPAYLIDYTS